MSTISGGREKKKEEKERIISKLGFFKSDKLTCLENSQRNTVDKVEQYNHGIIFRITIIWVIYKLEIINVELIN